MARREEPKRKGFKDGLRKVGKVYHYQFRVHGKPIHGSTRCTDLASAKAVLEEVRQQAIEEHYRPGLATTVKDGVKCWLTYLRNKGRSIRHQALAAEAMQQVLLPELGDLLLGELRQDHVDQVLDTARNMKTRWGHPWSEATINLKLRYVRTFLHWCEDREKLRRRLKVELVGDQLPPEKPALTPEQAIEFLRIIDARGDQAVSLCARVMLLLGLRVTEAVNLEWARWDPKRSVYTPRPSTTKSRKRAPLPVPDQLAELINAQPRKGDLIIPDLEGKPRTRMAIYRLVRQAAAKVGIKEFSPHGLRRTLGTLLADSGLNAKTVQNALRHSSIVVTYSHYVMSEAEKIRPAINALEDQLADNQGDAGNVTPLRKTGTSPEGDK